MATTSNPFTVLFADKNVQEIERSLRAHREVLTKITCYIDTAVNAATIMPTEKGCRELEQLKEKMEWKAEEMEADYDRLIELDPDNEKRYLEKKTHRKKRTRPTPAGNRTLSKTSDGQPGHP